MKLRILRKAPEHILLAELMNEFLLFNIWYEKKIPYLVHFRKK